MFDVLFFVSMVGFACWLSMCDAFCPIVVTYSIKYFRDATTTRARKTTAPDPPTTTATAIPPEDSDQYSRTAVSPGSATTTPEAGVLEYSASRIPTFCTRANR